VGRRLKFPRFAPRIKASRRNERQRRDKGEQAPRELRGGKPLGRPWQGSEDTRREPQRVAVAAIEG